MSGEPRRRRQRVGRCVDADAQLISKNHGNANDLRSFLLCLMGAPVSYTPTLGLKLLHIYEHLDQPHGVEGDGRATCTGRLQHAHPGDSLHAVCHRHHHDV
jgi:hypothetical protein